MRAPSLRLVVVAACALASCEARSPVAPAPTDGVRAFEGTWTASGTRRGLSLGDARKATIAEFDGTLLLSGAARPAVGFRAQALVLSDSATGLVGRAVWTDERGDQAFSELRGEGTAAANRIAGTFVGGTGRYAGVSGGYEFSWRFLLEDENGAVQGQSIGLKGRVTLARP